MTMLKTKRMQYFQKTQSAWFHYIIVTQLCWYCITIIKAAPLIFAVFFRSRAEQKKIDWEGSVGASLEEEIVCIEFYLHRGNQIAGSQDKHCTGHITQKNHTHLSTCKLCKFCKPGFKLGNFKKNISGLSIYSSYHIWLWFPQSCEM